MTFIHDRQLIETFFKAPDAEITFRWGATVAV
jgi:hypothetical protein